MCYKTKYGIMDIDQGSIPNSDWLVGIHMVDPVLQH